MLKSKYSIILDRERERGVYNTEGLPRLLSEDIIIFPPSFCIKFLRCFSIIHTYYGERALSDINSGQILKGGIERLSGKGRGVLFKLVKGFDSHTMNFPPFPFLPKMYIYMYYYCNEN